MKRSVGITWGLVVTSLLLWAPEPQAWARGRSHGIQRGRSATARRARAQRRARKIARSLRRTRRRSRRCRRLGDRLVKLKYLQGGSVWIPAEARCGGSFPVVVLLHGNNTSRERTKSLDGGRHLERWARRYLNRKLIRPMVLAEPIHFGACAPPARRKGLPYLFAGRFSFARYRKLLEATLRKNGIRASSWSFIGHSGAACCLTMGMFAIQKVWPNIRVWASADGCYNGDIQAVGVARLFAHKATKVINACRGYPAYRGYRRYERTLLTRSAKDVRCDKRYYKTCRRHPSKRWYSYVTRFSSPADHGKVLVELFKTVVFHDFPSSRRVAIQRRRAARRRRLARLRRRRARRRAHGRRLRQRRARQRTRARRQRRPLRARGRRLHGGLAERE